MMLNAQPALCLLMLPTVIAHLDSLTNHLKFPRSFPVARSSYDTRNDP